MDKLSKCSKNYVDCRKHPARSENPKVRFQEDFVYVRKNVNQNFIDSKKALDTIDDSSSQYKKDQFKLRYKQAEKSKLATQTEAAFNRFLANPVWSDGSKISPSDLKHIKNKRFALIHNINLSIEREDHYSKTVTLNSFQQAVASILVNDGRFSKGETSVWGDDRGLEDYQAKEHFKQCGVRSVNNYDESASWDLYDTFSRDNHVGIKAELSCHCGEFFKSTVYLDENAGSLLGKLMNQQS